MTAVVQDNDPREIDLSRGARRDVLKRTFKEYKTDNLTDLAAALTYYGVLAIFPMLFVLVSTLGLIGHSATQPLIENLGKVAPGLAREIFTSAIKNVQSSKGPAGILFIVGLAGRSMIGLRVYRGIHPLPGAQAKPLSQATVDARLIWC